MAKQPTAQPPLRTAIDEIQLYYTLQGSSITLEEIGRKVGKGKWWCSSLLKAEQNGVAIPEKTVPLLHLKFKEVFATVRVHGSKEKIISILSEKITRLESIVAYLQERELSSMSVEDRAAARASIAADEERRLDEVQASGLS